jgi:hypothetical protein
MRVRIDCIEKEPRNDPYHRIRRVGGPNGDGTRWNMSVDDAIRNVESGKYDFYVSQDRHTVNVVVATRLGHKYLKTAPDRDTPDNLLSLKECA